MTGSWAVGQSLRVSLLIERGSATEHLRKPPSHQVFAFRTDGSASVGPRPMAVPAQPTSLLWLAAPGAQVFWRKGGQAGSCISVHAHLFSLEPKRRRLERARRG